MTIPIASREDQELFLKAAEARYAELNVPPETAVNLFDQQLTKLASSTLYPDAKKVKPKKTKPKADVMGKIKKAPMRRMDEKVIPRKVAEVLLDHTLKKKAVGTNVAGRPAGPIATNTAVAQGGISTSVTAMKTPTDAAGVQKPATPGSPPLSTGGDTPKSPAQPAATGAAVTATSSFNPQVKPSTGTGASSNGWLYNVTTEKLDNITFDSTPVESAKDEKEASVELNNKAKAFYDRMSTVIKLANERNVT